MKFRKRRCHEPVLLSAPDSAHAPQPAEPLHAVRRRRCQLVDPLARPDHAVRHEPRLRPKCVEGLSQFRDPRLRIHSEQHVRRSSGIDQRPENIKHRPLPARRQHLSHRPNIFEGRVIRRREEKNEPQLRQRPAHDLRRRLQIHSQRREQIRAATFRSDPAVAVLHHRHTRARQRQHHHAGDIKPPCVIPARAHNVDRLIRPRLHPGIDRPRPKRRRKCRDFRRRFALGRQRQQKSPLHLVARLARGEGRRRRFHVRRSEVNTGGELGREVSKCRHAR